MDEPHAPYGDLTFSGVPRGLRALTKKEAADGAVSALAESARAQVIPAPAAPPAGAAPFAAHLFPAPALVAGKDR